MSGKATWARGRFYTPLDRELVQMTGREVYDWDRTFAERLPDYLKFDARVGYKMNRKKLTHEIALDVQNVTNRRNVLTLVFDQERLDLRAEYQLAIFPMVLYRVQF